MKHEGQKDLKVQNGSKEKTGQEKKDPWSVHVGFVVEKVALRQIFPQSTSVFPCQFHSTSSPLIWKSRKNFIIFITGLHKSLKASAAGPLTKKKLLSQLESFNKTHKKTRISMRS
jgi:hypothetical protein